MKTLGVTVLDVFDSTETFYKYRISRLVNLFHIKTTESLVKRELLFMPDSMVTESRINESENNLRSMGIFQWVQINSEQDSGDKRNVNVVVKDHFTSEASLSITREGNKNRYSFGLEDNNLIGRGYILDFYKSTRQNRDFERIYFKNPRTLGTRFEGYVDYLNYESAELYAVGLNKRFFSKETKWDLGANFLKFRGKQHYYFSRDNYIEIDNEVRTYQFSYGKYFGDGTRYRFGIDLNYKDEFWINDFENDRREDWNSRSVIFNFGAIRRDLNEGSFIDYSDVVEDVHTGFLYNIGIGLDLEPIGTDKKRNIYTLRTLYSRSLTPTENLLFELYHERIMQGGNDFHKLLNGRFSAFTTRIPHNTVGLNVEYRTVNSPRPYSQVFLGEDYGLRGYSLLEFIGKRSLLINIEDRFFSDLQILFFRVGGTVFFDIGKVWEEGMDFGDAEWHSGAGFGLRFGIPKISKGIIRIDFAYNFDRNKFTTVSFSNGSFFRLLYPIELGIPNFVKRIVN
ncbi:hypothetical protein ACFL6G_04605 [candidate division KSB1 bacterium]